VLACLVHDNRDRRLHPRDHGYWAAQLSSPTSTREEELGIPLYHQAQRFSRTSPWVRVSELYRELFGEDYCARPVQLHARLSEYSVITSGT